MLDVQILVFIALILVVGSLTAGVVSMAHGGDFDRKHSTQFMFARVASQALAVLILLFVFFLL